jgi:Uma2 family endonuclease
MLADKLTYYTYADYVSWGEDVRCEIINGVIYNMAMPSERHQSIVLELGKRFKNFLRGKECSAFIAPLDVRLNWETFDDTVVQPDVFVVCDKSKLSSGGCGILGAPDVIVEVLSPSTAHTDKVLKHRKYLEVGVKEYWVVDLESETLDVYDLEDGKYVSRNYGGGDKVPVKTLQGLEIDLLEIFAEV